MQPVLGLVPDGRLGAVEHVLGDLLAVVRGEAVEDDRIGAREREERVVDPVRGEIRAPALRFLLLAHARPDVGVEDVGVLRGLLRVADELDGAAHLDGGPLGGGDRVLIRVVALRNCGDESHPEARGAEHERDADVVPVAEVREAHAREALEPLANGHQVGERLAGMRVVG